MNYPGAARAHYENRRSDRPQQIWVAPTKLTKLGVITFRSKRAPKGNEHIDGAIPWHRERIMKDVAA